MLAKNICFSSKPHFLWLFPTFPTFCFAFVQAICFSPTPFYCLFVHRQDHLENTPVLFPANSFAAPGSWDIRRKCSPVASWVFARCIALLRPHDHKKCLINLLPCEMRKVSSRNADEERVWKVFGAVLVRITRACIWVTSALINWESWRFQNIGEQVKTLLWILCKFGKAWLVHGKSLLNLQKTLQFLGICWFSERWALKKLPWNLFRDNVGEAWFLNIQSTHLQRIRIPFQPPLPILTWKLFLCPVLHSYLHQSTVYTQKITLNTICRTLSTGP